MTYSTIGHTYLFYLEKSWEIILDISFSEGKTNSHTFKLVFALKFQLI